MSTERILEISCNGEELEPLTLAPGDRITIGRGSESDRIIADPHLSRKHVTVELSPAGELRATDLGSKNRTDFNGRALRESTLSAGDVITAGKCRIVVKAPPGDETTSTASFIETVDDEVASSTKFELDGEDPRNFVISDSVAAAGREPLEAIYRLAESVVGTTSREAVLDAIERTIAGTLEFDRFFIGLGDPAEETFEVARARSSANDDGQIRMSQSILDKVTTEKRAVLVEDAAEALPSATDSIRDLGISSFLCSPVIAKGIAVGLIYIDRREPLPPFEPDDLRFLQGIAHLTALALADLELREKVERENVRLREVIARKQGFIARSEPMIEVLGRVERYARHTNSVLILGETGTGKEHLARMLHDGSERSEGPFVAFNCALSSPGMIESELFGHVAGAFTGANRARKGRFALAEGGTLFLDEIGDMPVEIQAKLLRVLQEKQMWPVGGEAAVPIDVRIISATHHNLKRLRGSGEFRDDLYYRLAALTIPVPRLSKRGDDVLLIAESMLDGAATLSDEAKEALLAYSWPGNVRELENALEHALRNRTKKEIRPSDFPPEVAREGRRRPITVKVASLRDMEAKHIALALEAVGGNKRRAAELLGISRNTLYQKLQQYGL